jgi:peptidoglycan/xylan/chitin deacetylase (PgdA/CDA1 family)
MSDLLHRAPARYGLTRLWRRIHRSSVPVVLLHGVLPDADTSPFNSSGKFISPEKLRIFLERAGRIFRVVRADEMVEAALSSRRMDNAMVLTFDDGYANNFVHARPLLAKMGLPFTVFATMGFLDSDEVLWNDRLEFALATTRERRIPRGILPYELELGGPDSRQKALEELKEALKRMPLDVASREARTLSGALGVEPNAPELSDVRFMTSEEVRRMSQMGVGIGAHSVTHPILSRESQERVHSEVTACKDKLESVIGKPVSLFAYPNGRREDFNSVVKQELVWAGYSAAFTTIHDLYRPGGDLFEVPRISLSNQWSYEEFETRLTGILKAFRR